MDNTNENTNTNVNNKTKNNINNHAPWVEKYRPQMLENIVLDKYNRSFFASILTSNRLPHLLFYGPPGTGKTTTILSIIKQFLPILKHEVLHLNASDDRGIDVIRNQILLFVHSNTFFTNSMKFVILDEVDNMTKNAQHGLTYLLQSLPMEKVRFCLICNYISKIVPSLRNEFISVRFNRLPEKDVVDFLANIAEKEKFVITKKNLKRISHRFGSDVRSMINFLQTSSSSSGGCSSSNSSSSGKTAPIIFEDEIVKLASASNVDDFVSHAQEISYNCNCSIKEILREYFQNQILSGNVTSNSLSVMEDVMHTIHTNMSVYNLKYVWQSEHMI